MTTEWVSVPGFSTYEITATGKLRNRKTKKELSLEPEPDGYVKVSIFNDNRVRVSSARVHILVAMTFIANPDNKKTVNHKNKVRNDNNVINLEWTTSSEQNQHAAKGRESKPGGRPVWQCHADTHEQIEMFSSASVAARFMAGENVSASSITNVAGGRKTARGYECRTAHGFWWKYADEAEQAEPGEVWRVLDCIETNRPYQISNHGRILGPNGRLHNNSVSDSGYVQSTIESHKYKLHILVAQTFLPNPENLPCVNHIDGNKANPHFENLQWITFSGNSIHAGETGLTVNPVRRIQAYDKGTGELVGSWRTMSAAEKETGVQTSQICRACKGKHNVHCAGQMYWKYADEAKAIEGVKAYKDGEYCGQWLNAKATAAVIGCVVNAVHAACNGKRVTVKGFVTKYEKVNLGDAMTRSLL